MNVEFKRDKSPQIKMIISKHLGGQINQRNILIDFEGYQVYKKFYFKEVTICDLNEQSFRNLFIKTPIIKNNKTIQYLINYHHKIPMDYGNFSYKSLLEILNNSNIIYCKGKSQILNKYTNSKIIDIELLGCPKYQLTHSYRLDCQLKQHNNNEHCALNKAYFYYKWLNQYKMLSGNKTC